MSDHRATVKMQLDIYGQHYEHEMWINWNPDEAGCDSRVAQWYADRYADALNKSYLAGTDKPKCRGFQWVGQSFANCNGCGQPYWEHDYDVHVKRDSGPFDDDWWDYVPITDEQKARVRAKWGTR